MSDMVPEVLNAALDSLFTPKEPGELEYQGDDGLLYCRNCHTPVQCRVKLWGRDKIVPCLCRCQQEAMAEKKRQDELVERQRKIRQLKATGIQEKHLLEWNFGVAEDNKDIQMAKRYVEQWKKVKAENLGLLLIKCVFYSAEESKIISCNPAASLSAKGGTPKQEKKALTDEQVKILLDTIRGLPPYVFVMIGLYAGLRREEILALRWDCVFLDGATPYISVRRAWRSVNNRPVISTELKTPAAKRDIPIPGKLVECLKEAKEKSKSEYVISDRNGNALAESQFVRVWKYIAVRSTEERCYYTYVNGQKIKHVVKPKLGEHQSNNPKLVYTMDFQVTPHQLRHPYVKHTTKIFSLRLMDFQAQAYPDARRKTRGACQLHRGGQSQSPVRPLCNRKQFS